MVTPKGVVKGIVAHGNNQGYLIRHAKAKTAHDNGKSHGSGAHVEPQKENAQQQISQVKSIQKDSQLQPALGRDKCVFCE
jgi:hypothetical protein